MPDIQRIDPGTRFCKAVVANGMVYLAGMTADDLTQDVAGQTQQVLAKIDEALARANSSKSRLVSTYIWLRDIATFDEMNRVWDGWIDRANMPVRATVEARLAGDRYLVEIMVTAVQ